MLQTIAMHQDRGEVRALDHLAGWYRKAEPSAVEWRVRAAASPNDWRPQQ
jgi:hypothetical protein